MGRGNGETGGRPSVTKAGGRRTKNFTSKRAVSSAFARKKHFLGPYRNRGQHWRLADFLNRGKRCAGTSMKSGASSVSRRLIKWNIRVTRFQAGTLANQRLALAQVRNHVAADWHGHGGRRRIAVCAHQRPRVAQRHWPRLPEHARGHQPRYSGAAPAQCKFAELQALVLRVKILQE